MNASSTAPDPAAGRGMFARGGPGLLAPRLGASGLAAALLLGGLASSEALALAVNLYANGLPNNLGTVAPVSLTITPTGGAPSVFGASLTWRATKNAYTDGPLSEGGQTANLSFSSPDPLVRNGINYVAVSYAVLKRGRGDVVASGSGAQAQNVSAEGNTEMFVSYSLEFVLNCPGDLAIDTDPGTCSGTASVVAT
ncbi:MAG: hypothetical protein ACKO3N_21880, partial [Verrucomicrobiota bacterium]